MIKMMLDYICRRLALGDKASDLINNTLKKNGENKFIQWVKAKTTGSSALNTLTDELTKNAEKKPLDKFVFVNAGVSRDCKN